MMNLEGNTPVHQYVNETACCIESVRKIAQPTYSRRIKRKRPYLLLNLSQNRQLSLSHWSEQNGITTDIDTNICQKKNMYRQTLPPPSLGKTMANLHYKNNNDEKDKNLRKTNDNFGMNLMFHQWTQLDWNHIANNYSEEGYEEEALEGEFYDTLNDVDLNGISIGRNMDENNNDQLGCNSNHSSTWSSCSVETLESFDDDFLEMDRTTILATEYGPELFSRMMDNMISAENATMFQDFGMPFTFPIACIMVYAIQGQACVIQEILRSLDLFWTAYEHEAKAMMMMTDTDSGNDKENENGNERRKNEKEITESLENFFRESMGWCGWYLYLTYYRMKAFTHVLPFNTSSSGAEISEEDKEIALDAIGVIGLKLMRCGFIDAEAENSQHSQKNETRSASNSSISEQLIPCLRKIIQEEVDVLLSIYCINRIHVSEDDIDHAYQSIDSSDSTENEIRSCGLSAISFVEKEEEMKQKRMTKIVLDANIFISAVPTLGDSSLTGKNNDSHNHKEQNNRTKCAESPSNSWSTCSTVPMSSSSFNSTAPSLKRRARRRRPKRRTQRKTQRRSVLQDVWHFQLW